MEDNKLNYTTDNRIPALNVAKYLLALQNISDITITHLKLQKLLYYCEAYHLAMTDSSLIEDDIIAYDYGPVFEKVYQEYKSYGSQPIILPDEDTQDVGLSAEGISTISSVIEVYGMQGALTLMQKTHNEKPWKDVYQESKNRIISRETMRVYYKEFLDN